MSDERGQMTEYKGQKLRNWEVEKLRNCGTANQSTQSTQSTR
ncbi:hypothetical protein D1AOALGA4SA_11608 [Olavius algarvensis Delta 1 endosymbiont]|nr:hypothetical protein D1AOALGA4SA_11608 [Olavius algarvensis Delta 1 endosymbiont]